MITDVAKTQRQRDTERILQSIHFTTANSPVLVVLVGLPASGKTCLAAELSKRTGAAVIESDAVRKLLVQVRCYTHAENRRVFAAVHAAVDATLARVAMAIVDATNLAERDRVPLYKIAERRAARLVLVHVVAPFEVARQRLEQRASADTHSEANLSVYERMQWRTEEIRRPHRFIDTSMDIEPAVAALTKEMMQS